MAGLFFDGDLRRIYEVPIGGSFAVDGDGYRIYAAGAGSENPSNITTTQLWTDWVDWHAGNKWASLALSKAGGAFRQLDQNGVAEYANFDLTLINGWALVIANYPHDWLINGTLIKNSEGVDFDNSRITSAGASPRIQFASSGSVVRVPVGSGLDAVQDARLARVERLAEIVEMALVGGDRHTGSLIESLDYRTGQVLLDSYGNPVRFNRTGGAPLPNSPMEIKRP